MIGEKLVNTMISSEINSIERSEGETASPQMFE